MAVSNTGTLQVLTSVNLIDAVQNEPIIWNSYLEAAEERTSCRQLPRDVVNFPADLLAMSPTSDIANKSAGKLTTSRGSYGKLVPVEFELYATDVSISEEFMPCTIEHHHKHHWSRASICCTSALLMTSTLPCR